MESVFLPSRPEVLTDRFHDNLPHADLLEKHGHQDGGVHPFSQAHDDTVESLDIERKQGLLVGGVGNGPPTITHHLARVGGGLKMVSGETIMVGAQVSDRLGEVFAIRSRSLTA